MQMNKTLYAGCSYTSGVGFDLLDKEPGLWVNLLHNSVPELKETQAVNVGLGGRSNAGIFRDVCYQLTHRNDIKYVFVAFTSMPRYEINLGLETYPTRYVFATWSPGITEINLNDVSYTGKYLESVGSRFVTLVHLHYEILDMVYYVNTMLNLSKLVGAKIFFINAIGPWDYQYFTKLENVLPNSYTDFTKELLNFNTRDDEEIFKLYNTMHDSYNLAGGIHEDLWLNLYSSFRSLLVDRNSDDNHPGLKSNQIYHQLLQQSLISKL